jgi:glycosyltransferase involved in cell wall biosynthesis
MSRILASVGILTFNSAPTLRRALESVGEFDDIVVCDGGSTDSTLDIAREFGASVILQGGEFKHQDGRLKDFAGVRNQMLAAAKHDWFLYIDSDETASPGLVEDIRKITQKNTATGEPLVYKIPYGILMDGKEIKYSSSFPGYQTRFFNKQSGARFYKPVHERIKFGADVKIGTLKRPWYVHSTKDEWVHYVRETAGYRRIEVERCRGMSFGRYISFVFKNVRTSIVTLVRAFFIYLVHGFKHTLPVRGELGRVLNPLLLIADVTRDRFK